MRSISWPICLMLAPICLPCFGKDSAQDPEDMRAAISRSTFIFKGTVVKLNATTIPEVKASRSTAVVRVDEVTPGFGAPPDLAGNEITVQLFHAGSVRAHQQAVFFTKGWLMGESIAVIEVAPSSEAANWQQVLEIVQKIRQETADEALQRELASAELVFLGSVARVEPDGLPELPTEHTPLWQKAVILVQQPALKGQAIGYKRRVSEYTVAVYFPSSEDPVWSGSPKFKVGQTGIWLLHRKQMDLPGLENQYTALNPIDFQSLDQSQRIQQFLRSAR